ncbi:hypothetical protein L332_03435 [Agrococcus pavilionensis RW1]|uniref:Uncharacterized protein n=1 Tax=Agrococcus pavilionensis RW1 TaxID=1330458 RepID=U1L949_9MICO|nr:hypothetical protein [Agrococcus pavilionensis]ERG63508.1 hypothetical protein L332_03435 [Agrococcus pavilionensis RW1]
MNLGERVRVTCDARGCKARALHPARGWSEVRGLDFCRRHTARRAARFICPPEHRHAEVGTCYAIHKCRCDDCTEGARVREERRKRLHLYGRFDSGLVDAAPVREHVQMLQASGLGWKRIAELTGVGNTAIASLIYGRKGSNRDPRKGEVLKRVSREKAEKILALQPSFDHLRDGALVPAVGLHRRMQALVCMGYSLKVLGAKLGIDPGDMSSLMRRETVRKSTHLAVVALFDELWDVPAPTSTRRERESATKARKFAEQRRWLPPLAWDDPDTDVEPPAGEELGEDFVDEAVVVLAVNGERPRMTPAERREVVRMLHRERWGDPRIAEHAGMTARTVHRIRVELGLPGIDRDEQVAS